MFKSIFHIMTTEDTSLVLKDSSLLNGSLLLQSEGGLEEEITIFQNLSLLRADKLRGMNGAVTG